MTVELRIKALQDLIQVRQPIPVAVRQLRRFPWDSEAVLVTLTDHDLVQVLDRYLRGELSNADIEAWAEAIEGRDDIGYEPRLADTLREVIFQLANPALTAPLGPDLARQWRENISDSK